MTAERFNSIVEERKKKITAILQKKGAEYSRGGDRLHNFKRSAAFARQEPTTMAWMFNLKHLTSIADLVEDIESGKSLNIPVIDEKFGDAINYLILLEALILEAGCSGRN